MKHKRHPSKIIYIVLLVTAALCLCYMLYTNIMLLNQLDDTITRATEAESLVDAYTHDLASVHEALAALNADNEALQRSNDELRVTNEDLQRTNEKLRKALTAYDSDFSAATPTPPRYLDIPVDKELQSFIWSLCCEYDIEEYYELIFAVMRLESNFKSDVISSTNDYGLMQINTCNHSNLSKRLGITDFLDPYQNAHAGIYMLANLLHRYEVHDALMAYNMGERGAGKLWQQGIHSTNYSKTVLDYYKQFTEDI